MTLWEIGNLYRGLMFKVGWTKRQYWKRVEKMTMHDVLLAINPQSAMAQFKSDSNPNFEAEPSVVGNMIEAAGIPLE